MPIEQTHPPLTITKQIEADLIGRVLAAFYKAGDTVTTELARDPIAGLQPTKAGKPADEGTKPRPMHFVANHAGVVVLAVFKFDR